MNKTPYEVRLDVLKMAQEMLNREMALEEIKFNAVARSMIEEKQPLECIIQNSPKMYSVEDIISKSESLYNFVQDTTRSKKK